MIHVTEEVRVFELKFKYKFHFIIVLIAFFSDLGFLRPTLFNIVRFPNEECLDASNQSGTCYTALECKKLGGNPSSKCAKGLGTCCISMCFFDL